LSERTAGGASEILLYQDVPYKFTFYYYYYYYYYYHSSEIKFSKHRSKH